MKYTYKIDLNPDYPYVQETDVTSEKTMTWKLEEIMFDKNEIMSVYHDDWYRVREWLKENHSEIVL